MNCRCRLAPYLLCYLDFGPLFINIVCHSVHNIFYCRSDNRGTAVSIRPHSICQTQAADVRKSGLVLFAFDLCDSLILSVLIMYNSLSDHHVFDPLWSSHTA